ncbi:hypothetical protein BDY17DRAFT_295263 [Neohortaea acidophila]|uniref:Uncharacterized protein n=1 Tax=Neohortaea acidophila TaxID=245834 RepID=A0A6A6PWV6_9PEZI|nr:uncharacterized protein BDY17DRAFT_295263 [Neohortaea acidophila]KAF2484231.1 hypothetical protein BDY17DRAFT_295263 [Neohortaea acidophila]
MAHPAVNDTATNLADEVFHTLIDRKPERTATHRSGRIGRTLRHLLTTTDHETYKHYRGLYLGLKQKRERGERRFKTSDKDDMLWVSDAALSLVRRLAGVKAPTRKTASKAKSGKDCLQAQVAHMKKEPDKYTAETKARTRRYWNILQRQGEMALARHLKRCFIKLGLHKSLKVREYWMQCNQPFVALGTFLRG